MWNNELISYLSKRDFEAATEWKPEDLKQPLKQGPKATRKESSLDTGGHPVESLNP